MQGTSKNINIRGIVSTVPVHEVDNMDYIEKIESRRIKKQVLLTGIEKRRVCINGQKASDLATVAADKLLNELKWERDSIDVLIFVTQSPELSRPSTAFLIQNRLNIGSQCLVYDINLGCSGYVGGLETIAGILSITGGRGLLLVGESHALENGELTTSSLLVGDAASATAVECGEPHKMNFMQYSDGSRSNYIFRPFNKPGYMDGNGVLLFGLNEVVESVKKFSEIYNIEDADYYVFHQAQKMIVDGISKGAGLDEGKVLLSCREFGNTSSASIPITLCHNINRDMEDGVKNIFMCGFGIGLSWGLLQTEIDVSCIYPIIETDFVYEDREMFGL